MAKKKPSKRPKPAKRIKRSKPAKSKKPKKLKRVVAKSVKRTTRVRKPPRRKKRSAGVDPGPVEALTMGIAEAATEPVMEASASSVPDDAYEDDTNIQDPPEDDGGGEEEKTPDESQ